MRVRKLRFSLQAMSLSRLVRIQTDWQIPSSNDIGLASLLPLYGAEITEIQNIGDAPNALIDWLKRVIPDNDMIVVSGGVSVGDYDFVAKISEYIDNFKVIFHGVNIKPGKPTLFGVIDKQDKATKNAQGAQMRQVYFLACQETLSRQF